MKQLIRAWYPLCGSWHWHLLLFFFLLDQFLRVRTPGMLSTVTRCSRAAASPSAPPCSSSATKATSCPVAACSPATTETPPRPSGARGCPSVSVSHRGQRTHAHMHTYKHWHSTDVLRLLRHQSIPMQRLDRYHFNWAKKKEAKF